MQKLLDVIEDLDDVQDVYHNAEIPSRAGGAHESPRHRWRRPRTRPGLEAGAVAQGAAVYVAPGNGGTARRWPSENLPITDPCGAARMGAGRKDRP
jgi:hypothetical protein